MKALLHFPIVPGFIRCFVEDKYASFVVYLHFTPTEAEHLAAEVFGSYDFEESGSYVADDDTRFLKFRSGDRTVFIPLNK